MSGGATAQVAALLCALAGLTLLAAAALALRRRRLLAGAGGALLGLLLAALAALLALVVLGVQGYRALTREEVALVVRTKPAGDHIFIAQLSFPDGRRQSLALEGDQVYVDARILKWQPWANLLGLHTGYELDRIAGRYRDIDDERSRPHSVFPLGDQRAVDLFAWRLRYAWLAPLVDASYGSATFVAADRPATYEIRVSTSGLLAREVSAAP